MGRILLLFAALDKKGGAAEPVRVNLIERLRAKTLFVFALHKKVAQPCGLNSIRVNH
jgi:hypothetical protein